jgi:type IV pilus assembly protein PilN
VIRINLLPHREEKRKAKRQQFFLLAALMAVSGLAIWFVGHTVLAGYLSSQEERNAFLKEQTALLDKDLAEIKGLKEQSEALLSRKRVIESLQTNRTSTVRIFNQLTETMPDGTYLRLLRQAGPRLNLQGYAQSNARVAALMRNLEASPVFERPELVEVKVAILGNNARRVSDFNLNVYLERPKSEEADKPKQGGKK